MKILINNSVTEIYNNKLYDYYIFDSNKPIIISEFIKNNKYYTYFVINIDTDTTNNKQIEKFYIHLLIINNSNIIFNYQKPKPPKNSGIHLYHVLIYEQTRIYYLKNNDRININLDDFINKYNLLLIDKFIFKFIHK